MKRVVLAALVIAALVAGGVPAWASQIHDAKPPKLGAMLLSIGQMPTGWAVYNEPSNGLGCLANILEPKGIKQTASATIEFEDNGNLPGVDERLATFTDATTAYRKIVANLTACKHLSGTTSGEKFSGTVGQASFPHYGNASVAFEASFTIQGESLGEDILIAREGSIVMGIDEGDLQPMSTDLSQFQGFVKKALAKLS